MNDPALSGGTEAVSYVVQSGDTLSSIATNLAASITADTNLQGIGVNAVASIKPGQDQVHICESHYIFAVHKRRSHPRLLPLGVSSNAVQNATILGTVTSGNVLTQTSYDAALGGGSASVTYTATSGGHFKQPLRHILRRL